MKKIKKSDTIRFEIIEKSTKDKELERLPKLFDKPEVELIGEDGNVFNLIGIVAKALKNAGYKEYAKEMQERAMNCESYDDVLNLFSEYVHIE